MIILVDGANNESSFVMRSTIPWNMNVPLDNRTLAYKFLPVSASHVVLLLERSLRFPATCSCP